MPNHWQGSCGILIYSMTCYQSVTKQLVKTTLLILASVVTCVRYTFLPSLKTFCTRNAQPPPPQNYWKLCKKLYHTLLLVEIVPLKMGSPWWFLSSKHLQLELRMLLTGCPVAMVTSNIKKREDHNLNCLSMIGQGSGINFNDADFPFVNGLCHF